MKITSEKWFFTKAGGGCPALVKNSTICFNPSLGKSYVFVIEKIWITHCFEEPIMIWNLCLRNQRAQFANLSLSVQLVSLWHVKLKLLGYQLFIPTCFIQVRYSQMATIRHGIVQIIKKTIYLCQFNLVLYETVILSSWGTNYLSGLVWSR